MSVRDIISAGMLVGIDTAPFIYYIERGSLFTSVAVELFDDCVMTGRNSATTTTITLAEVLVNPIQTGHHELAERYRNILRRNPEVALLTITPEIAERAADLRARYRLPFPMHCR